MDLAKTLITASFAFSDEWVILKLNSGTCLESDRRHKVDLCVGIVAVLVLLFLAVYFLIYVVHRFVAMFRSKSGAGTTEDESLLEE